MIDFIGAHEGCIELYSGDDFVAAYRSPIMLAEAIIKAGGPAPVVYSLSSFDEAVENGWESKDEIEWVWKKVCELI